MIQEFMEGGPLLKEKYAVEPISEDVAVLKFIQVIHVCAKTVRGSSRPSSTCTSPIFVSCWRLPPHAHASELLP